MTKKKKGRAPSVEHRPHPRNRYAENAPDFALLASRYDSFAGFVKWSASGKASIDWCDYNATRELTRVLLDHDYGIKWWWIPDGQLCPTVTNRANYIHWIEDLLHEFSNPKNNGNVRGVDIGTGASCIYPLLGASLHGWNFVGTDITNVALEWATRNIQENPHLAGLIEVRNSGVERDSLEQNTGTLATEQDNLQQITRTSNEPVDELYDGKLKSRENRDGKNSGIENAQLEQDSLEKIVGTLGTTNEHVVDVSVLHGDGKLDNCRNLGIENAQLKQDSLEKIDEEADTESFNDENNSDDTKILVGVVKEDEEFDFCMCNPPFFESMDEAGLNPRTACGGTEKEMVCPGGEAGFVARMIQDSIQLGTRIHWYTTMVGKKSSIKVLTSQLWKSGVTMVRTTEFVQGRTSRWGLAWTYSPLPAASNLVVSAKTASFMLEGLNRQSGAWDVLQNLATCLEIQGATCVMDKTNFTVTGSVHVDSGGVVGKRNRDGVLIGHEQESGKDILRFTASVLQQVPGCLLVKFSAAYLAERFLSILKSVETALREQFSSKTRQKMA